MSRLIGGQFLLNLTGISLGLNSGELSITDAGVLAQLLELRNFIDEKRDFTKESKGLKPVLIQYRSNASKIDGIAQCNLSFNTDALHLSIAGYSVQADGTPLTIRINVEYEFTSYVGYTIKTAKLDATKNFIANVISQSNANYSLDLRTAFQSGNYDTYFKSDTAFLRFEEINGVLWFVISGQFVAKAQTGSNATFNFVIPSEFKEKYYSKLYRMDGTTLNNPQDFTGDILLSAMALQVAGGLSTKQIKLACATTSENPDLNLTIVAYGNTSEDDNVKIDIRIPILLI